MTVIDSFKMSWEEAVSTYATDRTYEIIPERKIMIHNVYIGSYHIAEYIVVFGEDDYPAMMAVRFVPDILTPIVYLRTLKRRKLYSDSGIVMDSSTANGVLTCTYTKQSYLQQLQEAVL